MVEIAPSWESIVVKEPNEGFYPVGCPKPPNPKIILIKIKADIFFLVLQSVESTSQGEFAIWELFQISLSP